MLSSDLREALQKTLKHKQYRKFAGEKLERLAKMCALMSKMEGDIERLKTEIDVQEYRLETLRGMLETKHVLASLAWLEIHETVEK